MSLSEILQLLHLISVIDSLVRALQPITAAVFLRQKYCIDTSCKKSDNTKGQSNAKADWVLGALVGDEDVAGYESTTVPETGKNTHGDSSLDTLANVGAEPNDNGRHVNEGTARDEKHAHVENTGLALVGQLNSPADDDEKRAERGEQETVVEVVA